ncbi:hypothetical protein A2954_01245 [Candidatus Roizmanbacteria bacterium RIFCSPLOWO2_01_FULL_37_12]|uniref:Ribonuclease VapC n=1 Tax=Candidatus Roizmanbacteria bacterium RIFCSPLOWO2_01_FULL_37_12 TaxID=1802056 RepID=A0A1F7IGH4_9BACT|nr:MAG: hypothetical protein A3D76_06045 [Candidatus Roizmanbacteria bacterium RIFCSPHIGHO2_02_FULL_37_9b]OGK42451.1 MAG: hypothetical protein A2954_01245 [Candidatus Roizmanbacteria bacterium RIFCSPLOWO2_01_FULL_37_12]
MVRVLIDTDIIIDYLRTREGLLPELLELQVQKKLDIYISTVTIMELFSGKSSKEKEINLMELISVLKIVELKLELSKFTGELKRDYNLSTMSFADLFIAACALFVNAKLATRNRKHFQGIPKLKFYR